MNAKACLTVAEREIGALLEQVKLQPTADGAFALTLEQVKLIYALGVEEGWGRGYDAGKGRQHEPKRPTVARGELVKLAGPRHGEPIGAKR